MFSARSMKPPPARLRETRLVEAQLVAAQMPLLPFGLQGSGEKRAMIELALGRLLKDGVELGTEMLHAEPA